MISTVVKAIRESCHGNMVYFFKSLLSSGCVSASLYKGKAKIFGKRKTIQLENAHLSRFNKQKLSLFQKCTLVPFLIGQKSV